MCIYRIVPNCYGGLKKINALISLPSWRACHTGNAVQNGGSRDDWCCSHTAGFGTRLCKYRWFNNRRFGSTQGGRSQWGLALWLFNVGFISLFSDKTLYRFSAVLRKCLNTYPGPFPPLHNCEIKCYPENTQVGENLCNPTALSVQNRPDNRPSPINARHPQRRAWVPDARAGGAEAPGEDCVRRRLLWGPPDSRPERREGPAWGARGGPELQHGHCLYSTDTVFTAWAATGLPRSSHGLPGQGHMPVCSGPGCGDHVAADQWGEAVPKQDRAGHSRLNPG